jgi:3-oxoacyl-[acyl-carrier protein] reductase
MDLKEQVVLVTGGARGIGKAIAENFAKRGADLVIADISLSSAEETAKEIAATGVRTLALGLDVSKSGEVTAAFEKIMKEFGRIDVVINNAGITRDGLILRMKEEDWDAVININLKGRQINGKAALRQDCKYRLCRCIYGKPRTGELQRFKGRHRWSHKNNRERVCEQGGHCQRCCAWIYCDCHDRCFT